MRSSLITAIGFIMVGVGLLAIILTFVGLHLSFLKWIDDYNGLLGIVVKILLVMVGMIVIVFSRTNWKEENS